MNPFHLFRYVPLSLLRALARLVGWVMRYLPTLNTHRIIRINLDLAYPHLSDAQKIERHHAILINQALTGVESVKTWAMSPEWAIDQIYAVHNEQVLQDGLANPNGMLAIVPHLGTWEVMNAWLNQFGSPTIMYKPVKGELTDDFVRSGRERLNATLVPTDSTVVKALFKTLKQGGFSIILPDHVPDKSAGGVVVPFFRVNTLTSTLASKLASKTKCALVGLVCIRRSDGKHKGKFDIFCYDLADPKLYAKDIDVATTAMNQAIETMINAHPEHYMWGYKRFKNIPKFGNAYKLDAHQLDVLKKATIISGTQTNASYNPHSNKQSTQETS